MFEKNKILILKWGKRFNNNFVLLKLLKAFKKADSRIFKIYVELSIDNKYTEINSTFFLVNGPAIEV